MDQSPVKYRRHIFVCVNERSKEQSCGPDGGKEILEALRSHINRNGLFHTYNISKVFCLGHCLQGPTVAVYPEGKIFTRVTKHDIKEIIEKFLT